MKATVSIESLKQQIGISFRARSKTIQLGIYSIMTNALEVLRQKELDLAKLRKETEALRIVAPLLRDDERAINITSFRNEQIDLQCTGTDGFQSSVNRVFAAEEWEVDCGQPFLVPPPTNPDPSSGLWLREKGRMLLTGLREKKQMLLRGLRDPRQRWWYGGVGAILLVVAIGGFAFGNWLGHRISVNRSAVRASAASPRQSASGAETNADRTSEMADAIELSGNQPNNQASSREALVDSALLTRQPAFETGGAELVMGRRYLQGQGVTQDHAEAARWLWKSVAKQNGDAALLLSDLFARGDGVPRNCEQARLLLTVAAEHSSKTSIRESAPSNPCISK